MFTYIIEDSECVSYLMNIGGSGYSGVYCKVMENDPMPLDTKPKIAYQQCLDTPECFLETLALLKRFL